MLCVNNVLHDFKFSTNCMLVPCKGLKICIYIIANSNNKTLALSQLFYCCTLIHSDPIKLIEEGG